MKARTFEEASTDARYSEIPSLQREFILDLFGTQNVYIEELVITQLDKLIKDECVIEQITALVFDKLITDSSPRHKGSVSAKEDSIIVPIKRKNDKEIRRLVLSHVPTFVRIFGNREFPSFSLVEVLEASIELSPEERELVKGKKYTRFHSKVISVCTDKRWKESPFEQVRRGVYRLSSQVGQYL